MACSELYCVPGTGSNLNAGTGTGAASLTYASGNWVQSTRVFTVASGDPVADGVAVDDMVSVYPDGSSAPAVFVGRVTARTTTTITVSGTANAGTAPTDGTGNMTLVVGGAWAGPSGTSGFPLGFARSQLANSAGDPVRINLKNNSTYSITAAMTHNLGLTIVQGYSSTPGDGGRAVIDGGTSGASYTLLTSSTGHSLFADLEFRNNGATGTAALVACSIGSVFLRCVFHDSRGHGLSLSSGASVVECEAYACNKANSTGLAGFGMTSSTSPSFYRCVSHDNTGSAAHGFQIRGNNGGGIPRLVGCVADSNGGAGFLLDASTTAHHQLHQCVAYNNGSDGIRSTVATHTAFLENCLLVSNAGRGVNFNVTPTAFPTVLTNCAFFGNGTGETNNVNSSFVSGSISLTVSPFADAANGNFAVTQAQAQAAGRGTFLQSSGYSSSTTSYPDVGAVQTSALLRVLVSAPRYVR